LPTKNKKNTKAVVNKRNKEEFVKERYTLPMCKGINDIIENCSKGDNNISFFIIICRKGYDKDFPNIPLYPLYIFCPSKIVVEKIHFAFFCPFF